LHKRGQTAQAVALLKGLAGEKSVHLPGLAAVLEELGAVEEARGVLLRHVRQEKQPTEVFVLVAFLARQRRIGEALDLCEQATHCPPEAVVQSALLTLSRSPQDPVARGRVGRLLNDLRSRLPASVFQLAQANLRTLEGRRAEAEALYRKVLAANPTDAVALNNLAYLLALGGKGRQALEIARRAAELLGPNPTLLRTQALAYLADHQLDRALSILEELERESPSLTGLFHLARAYQAAKKPQAARRAFLQARQKGLTPTDLHPLEQAVFADLQRSLGVN
jgi:tetratricopeptide (TPR) repeat protein